MSHRAVSWVIVAVLLVIAVGAPVVVGVTLGTGPDYNRIPFGVASFVIGGGAVVAWYLREGRHARRVPGPREDD